MLVAWAARCPSGTARADARTSDLSCPHEADFEQKVAKSTKRRAEAQALAAARGIVRAAYTMRGGADLLTTTDSPTGEFHEFQTLLSPAQHADGRYA